MLNRDRGQSIPFWLVATVIVLSMCFFLTNYVNLIAWHIRAQNAADSAAATVLSPSTNVLNQETLMLYAQVVNENRLRYLNQGMLNAINGVGCSSYDACNGIYQSLLAEYIAALNAYNDMNQTIQQANNYTQGGQIAADEKAAAAIIGGGVGDDAFSYTTLDSGSVSGKGKRGAIRQVDIVACAHRSFFAPLLLRLGATAGFDALGRAGAVARPRASVGTAPAGWFLASSYSEYFQPGLSVNPLTSAAYQPLENPALGSASAYYGADFSTLTVGLSWYIANAIQPYMGSVTTPKDYTCK